MAKIPLKKFHAVVGYGNRALRDFNTMVKDINTEYRKNAQLVRVTSSKGYPTEGFFNRIEVVYHDKLRLRVVTNPIIETEDMIMASTNEDHTYDALSIEPYTHKRFKYRLM